MLIAPELHALSTAEYSVLMLDWINNELRKQAEPAQPFVTATGSIQRVPLEWVPVLSGLLSGLFLFAYQIGLG